jgi:branched-chain amino acid transport system ATP-binding protein
VIATDTPKAIRNNSKVNEAYLGASLDEGSAEGAH